MRQNDPAKKLQAEETDQLDWSNQHDTRVKSDNGWQRPLNIYNYSQRAHLALNAENQREFSGVTQVWELVKVYVWLLKIDTWTNTFISRCICICMYILCL
jgi:hypothetical protein